MRAESRAAPPGGLRCGVAPRGRRQGPTRSSSGDGEADQGPRRSSLRRSCGESRPSGRLPVRRVRGTRIAARLLRRSRSACRRLPEGGVGPGAAVRRGRPDVPQGLLPPADRHQRLAARVLGRHRPRAHPGGAGHRRGGRAADDQGADLQQRGRGADLARQRRSRAPLPARHRRPRQHGAAALDHRQAVRDRP